MTGGTYAWTGPNNFTATVQNPTIDNAQPSASGQYCVTVTLNGCQSPQSCTNATVNAIPNTVASNSGPICAGATLQLSATSVAGGCT